MKSLVIGNGQIGQAVTEVISKTDKVTVYDSKFQGKRNEPPILRGIDIIHICFPCKDQKEFIDDVNYYIKKYMTHHVIIWATVPIGTTKRIRGAVHSPVEGRHPKLASSVRSMRRWIGYNSSDDAKFFEKYFTDLQFSIKSVPNSDFTEFLKLRSTSKFGINLVWVDYEASVAKDLGMDFQYIKDFDMDYNRLYKNIGMDWAQRYILDDPNGKIGGHCVVPNAELLDEQYPSDLLKMIKEMK